MGTSQVPLVLKLAHRYGQGTESIQANRLDWKFKKYNVANFQEKKLENLTETPKSGKA